MWVKRSGSFLPIVLIFVVLAISWYSIVYYWKHYKKTERDGKPKEMSAMDYLKIVVIVIGVLMIWPRAPELIGPLLPYLP
jgi:heme/copper-type cytochrome/quinol oxidase subunit 2